MEKKLEVRPWGSFTRYTHNELSTVKIINVLPNQQLSLQYHEKREEFWRILRGTATLIIDGKTIQANPGEEFYIKKGESHRIAALGDEVEILEISFGEFDESDIVRLEDKYGRTSTPQK